MNIFYRLIYSPANILICVSFLKKILEWSGNAERYKFCVPRPWVLSGVESGNLESLCTRLRRELTFSRLSRICYTIDEVFAKSAKKGEQVAKVQNFAKSWEMCRKSLLGAKVSNFNSFCIGFAFVFQAKLAEPSRQHGRHTSTGALGNRQDPCRTSLIGEQFPDCRNPPNEKWMKSWLSP